MTPIIRPALLPWLTAFTLVVSSGQASAQPILLDLMQRHGVALPERGIEGAFDEGVTPMIPVTAGSFAGPLAMLTSSTGGDQIAAAYAFGILAGRSGRAAAPAEVAAAGQALVQMIVSADRRARIAGARVAGRVLAVPFEATAVSVLPPGLADAFFALLNRTNETEQLAALDALGLVREPSAVSAITERYYFYRESRKRALAGGAVEALARIGDASSVDVVKVLAADRWAEGKDATALAVAFARQRLLKDGSLAVIQQALDDKSRRAQARGYLAELGAPVP
ncbi:MAG: hypothetical protein A3J29_00860 [Acidobacteria bacterium RIFCSPLOWO2_12_FULL_67_14b]|nr:MAG: hypothetical protein A3J29_00860 [Acidobacteria bacterium RIFCSPLOWO2_12_FULL_67_14b]